MSLRSLMVAGAVALLSLAACIPGPPTPTPVQRVPPQNPPVPASVIQAAPTPPSGTLPTTPIVGYPAPPTPASTDPRPVPTLAAYPKP